MTTEISIFTEQGFATTMKIADAMVKSGILPRGIDNPFKAFAIIQKGREMGVEPMRALTGIYLIEGKTVVSPELKLECFRARGGKVQWIESTNTIAHVKLTSADGTSHDETVTMQDAATAGLTGKDNWRKYPKSMLRARCVAFALRAMGEGDGAYIPEEMGAQTDEEGNAVAEYTPPNVVTESRERIAGPQEAPQDAGKANGAPSASESSDHFTPADAPSASKPRTAAQVKPTGGPITPEQIKAIHTLVSRAGNITDEKYREGVAVYRQMDGSRCVGADGKGTSKLLSKDQASHLINRLEDKCARQESRAAQGVDIGAIVPPAAPAPGLINLAAKHFDTDDELASWLHALFGASHPKELDANQSETALALLMVIGTDKYDEAEEKARALGRVR